MRFFVALLAVFSCASTAAMTNEAPRIDETKQFVAVDGARRLFLDCKGQGEPTIIFDSGYGSTSANWLAVQAILAPKHKACFYDRAGMGYSDAPSRPTRPSNVVDDLHRLIQKAQIKTPIVLIGHSRAGLYDTLYALTYRSEIAAMVLLDPVVAQNNEEKDAISPSERAFLKKANSDQDADQARCEGLAKAGALTEADPHGCFSFSNLDTPAIRKYALHMSVKPEYYQTMISEKQAGQSGLDTETITEAERRTAHPFGNSPLIVLTSSKPMQYGSSNPSDDVAADRIWKNDHEQLAKMSSVGRHLIVPNTGHLIQLYAPQAVADAVNTVLQECCRAK
jgi:pimeloyl-ACP methyl ester carboxylesterase